jgi:arylsulfatase A-like enzyme
LRKREAIAPDRPFFTYWASGAAHGSHHVLREWAGKYAGRFDDGWDARATHDSNPIRRPGVADHYQPGCR